MSQQYFLTQRHILKNANKLRVIKCLLPCKLTDTEHILGADLAFNKCCALIPQCHEAEVVCCFQDLQNHCSLPITHAYRNAKYDLDI